jgi:hypothetical protein
MFSRDIFSVRGHPDFNGYLSKNAAAMLRRPMGNVSADFIHYQIYVDFGYIVRFWFSRIFVSSGNVLLRHNDPFKHDIQKTL